MTQGRTRLGPWLALAVFALLSVALALGLKLNPREVPSPLVGKPLPSFALPALGAASAPISSQQWRGQWWVLNVWASWCTPCAVEHPVLLQLAQSQRVTLVGLNYKDASPAAQTWLTQRGNPYQTVWVDTQGSVGLDLGVYGVPETYIIDPQGRVRHKHTGAVTPQWVQSTLLPLLETSRG